MKTKFLYLVLFLGCFLAFPLVGNAECSYERQAELSRIAANVKFSYVYEANYLEDGHIEIPTQIIITNLTNDIYLQETGSLFNQRVSGNGEKILNSTIGSQTTFNIYSNDNNCKNELLMTQSINIPSYNYFSTSDECKDNPEFYLCPLWMNTTGITSEKFNAELKKYKAEQEKQMSNTEDADIWDKIQNVVDENKTVVVISIIIVVLFAIYGIYHVFRRRH